MFFNKKRYTPESDKMKRVIDTLFPQLTTHQEDDIRFQVDNSVDSNLEAALMDLQSDINDETVHNTIRSCINRIRSLRKTLDIHHLIDLEAQYLMVQPPDNEDDFSDIIPQE